uniref:(northern house mosquito) hypothetical protein n=1 Tax=Culex pipiens TaxID=7175 RepID=A0A8D8P448_CULPI
MMMMHPGNGHFGAKEWISVMVFPPFISRIKVIVLISWKQFFFMFCKFERIPSSFHFHLLSSVFASTSTSQISPERLRHFPWFHQWLSALSSVFDFVLINLSLYD